MKRLTYLLIAVALAASAAVVAAGRGGSDGGSVAQAAAKRAGLTPFGSCDRLRGYLRRHLPDGGPVYPGVFEDAVAGEARETGEAGSAPAPSEGKTNVQEEGVDEPDIVKASGSTLFVLAGDRLRAVDVSGAQPAVLDSIELPDGTGEYSYAEDRQLLLTDGRALVISRSYGEAGSRTLLTDIDVADPSALRELATESVEGNYVSARLTGDTARVVIAAYPEMPVAERGHGRAWMPRTVVRDRVTHRTTRRSLMPCDDVRRPTRFSGTEMISVLTIDMVRGLPAIDTDAVMAGGEIVYASPTSLYVATQRWLGPPEPPTDVATTTPASSQVTTEIHRFDVADPSATGYVASGEVEGFMLNQWSMSEQDGVLRVASTSAPPWEAGSANESESYVTVLRPEGDRLVKIGRVGGLGRGEQIYAVRFIGELGYVVTFRQVDPLYVLDLSDPRDPRKLGELKIPGYSAYLHPVDDGLLLGVGQDATAEGQTTGVQVSLFDVSDPAAPVRVDRASLGRGTYTEVEYDHHAFTYSPEHRLAVLPVSAWTAPSHEFYGAVGVRYDPAAGLQRTARTSHGAGYESEIRRSVVVDGRVFTISGRGVAEHDPATLERLALTPYAG